MSCSAASQPASDLTWQMQLVWRRSRFLIFRRPPSTNVNNPTRDHFSDGSTRTEGISQMAMAPGLNDDGPGDKVSERRFNLFDGPLSPAQIELLTGLANQRRSRVHRDHLNPQRLCEWGSPPTMAPSWP